MIEVSVLGVLAEKAEAELLRVSGARPFLRSRCERAAGIIVAHLAMPHQRVIRARVRGGELVGCLVCGSDGQLYRVEASGRWRCSCPDHHRRSQACKHGLAAWALWRASTRPAPEEPAEAPPAEIPAEPSRKAEPRRRHRVFDPAAVERLADKLGVG